MKEKSREYQKVITYLSDMIAAGELTMGSRLPTERKIAEILSIGRNSTREALRMLENTGVIESRRGSGNYLVGNLSRAIFDVVDMMLLLRQTDQEEICSFRRNMEKAVCRTIVENHTFFNWRIHALELLNASAQSDSFSEQVELDRQFHYLLIHATENNFWITMMEPIADVYRRWIDAALLSADEQVTVQLHQAHVDMFQALENSDIVLCEKAIERHYNLVDGEMRKENT
ncbi:GntR family transcriptional regulator [Ruminococcus sp.]|uniref:FadR/GntR family transcriptional regulator n=1 Tax=Ruminococcus sp. TaxID=41978 RepID=UPI0025FB8C07|nr:GntR family transcriptional regulator [Ruminococcus sp.]